jgi:hypothetical protein
MKTREDIESFLIQMNVGHEELDDGMWVIRTPEGAPVVVQYEPPVIVLRLKFMDLPAAPERDDVRFAGFYRRLLELNAGEIVHGSYGIEGDEVVISDALELETLDFHELRSSYESILLAATSHPATLAELVPVAHES